MFLRVVWVGLAGYSYLIMGYVHFPLAAHQILQRADGKILLLKRSAHRSFLPSTWFLPAGHHDGDQTLEESAAREALEEVGVEIDMAYQRAACFIHSKVGLETISAFFVATKWRGEAVNNEPQEADEIGWFDIDNLPSPLPNFVRDAIRAAVQATQLIYIPLDLERDKG